MKMRNGWIVLGGILAGCNTSESCDCVTVESDVRIVQNAQNKGPNAFSPANFTISLATQDTVKWWNRDFSDGPYGGNTGVTHRLVSDDGTTFDSGNILPNGTFVVTMSAAASIGYHCAIHPAMTGTVTVNP